MNSQAIVDWLGEGARSSYGRDGKLSPLWAGLTPGGGGIIATLAGGTHPVDAFFSISSMLSVTLELSHVACVTEAWTKSYDPDDAPKSMPRGFLQEAALQGDPGTRTVCVVQVFEVYPSVGGRKAIGLAEMNYPQHGPEGLTWNTELLPQREHHGHLPAAMLRPFFSPERKKRLEEAPLATLEQWADALESSTPEVAAAMAVRT